MLGRQKSRRRRAERAAGQAWENLTSAVDSAGSSTRSAGRRAATLLDDTSSRVESGAKEARRRANAAIEALAGRRPARPWGLLAGVAFIGVALGWVSAALGRRVVSRTQTTTGPGTETAPRTDAVPVPRTEALPDSLADAHHDQQPHDHRSYVSSELT